MTAPVARNWRLGHGLTWSGKWHVLREDPDLTSPQARALCGAYVYTFGHVPTYVPRLNDIAAGRKDAPVCKLCQRAEGVA